MRLLVIGGTVFVGRAVVEAALARGDEVTVFHRGRHGRGAFADAETILGDRTTDLDRLAGREWDVVVDTCGFRPEHVRASGRALAGAVDRYVFVSTAGVYRDWPLRPVPDEDAPLHTGEDDDYSVLKAACERALEAELPGRVVHARPGSIVGPHENIGRLPWWLDRMARGGRVLAPGPPDAPMQLVDARDLAAFLLGDAAPGGYSVISPPGAFAWGEFLQTARDVAGRDAELVWTAPERVMAEVTSQETWTTLPMWPAPWPDMPAVYGVGVARAIEAGLRIRPLRDTIADTWAWLSGPEGELSPWRSEVRATGLDPERERALLS
jgi:2'-hydroxyisoflavone reductase